MKSISLLIFGSVLIASCYGLLQEPIDNKNVTDSPTTSTTTPANFTINPPEPKTISPEPSTTTTTSKPTTTTTTTSTTTTTPPTTTTTTPPTTTTTTTPKPTTTPSPAPSTTTTTAKPTVPTTPAPHVDPKTGKWNVTYINSNVSCIIAKMALEIDVTYMKDNKTTNLHVDVPEEAIATGSCLNKSDEMVLSWNNNNSMVFTFDKVNETYGLNSIVVKLNITGMNDSLLVLNHDSTIFNNTKVEKSYKCEKNQKLNLTSTVTNLTAFIQVSHLQLQAFYNKTSYDFSDAIDCEPFITPDIVPIAAGCALAALIIIVLIAYLLGRRRSQARGYLSM